MRKYTTLFYTIDNIPVSMTEDGESTVSDFNFSSFYRMRMRKKGKAGKDILPDDDAKRIQGLLWKKVRDKYIENEGGVFIRALGYFCHMIKPKINKKVFNKCGKSNMEAVKMSTDMRGYRHMCLPLDNEYFYMLRLKNSDIKKSMKNLQKGVRYKFLFNEIMSYMQTTQKKKYRISLNNDRLARVLSLDKPSMLYGS